MPPCRRTESAKANRQAMAQSLQLARLNYGYTRLTADAECSVASLNMELNEKVSAGTQVAVVNCGDRWEVEIAVPESLIAAFRPDMTGTVRFDAIPRSDLYRHCDRNRHLRWQVYVSGDNDTKRASFSISFGACR